MRKLIAIATAVTIAIIVSVSFAIPADAESAYTLNTIIVDIDPVYDYFKVECLDENGDTWEFYDEYPWNFGDVAVLRMRESYGDYTNDEVMDVSYNGHLELHEIANFILESIGE